MLQLQPSYICHNTASLHTWSQLSFRQQSSEKVNICWKKSHLHWELSNFDTYSLQKSTHDFQDQSCPDHQIIRSSDLNQSFIHTLALLLNKPHNSIWMRSVFRLMSNYIWGLLPIKINKRSPLALVIWSPGSTGWTILSVRSYYSHFSLKITPILLICKRPRRH